MQKTWREVLQRLLTENVLFEDSKGVIQIRSEYYLQLGRQLPASLTFQKDRTLNLAKLYINLWPKKIMSGGRPVRQGPVAISIKLAKFLNTHPEVTDEAILNATSRYIAYKTKTGWDYATCSDYFISKNNTSILESYLEDPEMGSKEFEKKEVTLNQRTL